VEYLRRRYWNNLHKILLSLALKTHLFSNISSQRLPRPVAFFPPSTSLSLPLRAYPSPRPAPHGRTAGLALLFCLVLSVGARAVSYSAPSSAEFARVPLPLFRGLLPGARAVLPPSALAAPRSGPVHVLLPVTVRISFGARAYEGKGTRLPALGLLAE
jgi:hypothetical protein